jgi:hypothetical protein
MGKEKFMTSVFIDTNIFLGLYETNNDTLKIFKDINKIKKNLVIPDQIYYEFLRNRDLILQYLITNLDKNFKINKQTTSLICHLNIYKKIETIQKDFDMAKRELISDLKEIKNNTSKDPIFQSFVEIYRDELVLKLKTNEKIIKTAQIRNLIGNPPYSVKKATICDEIIWEMFLDNIRDDLIIVSRDTTYEDHITFLSNEFTEKTKKKLMITENISDALKIVGKTASPELIKYEKTVAKSLSDIAKDIQLSQIGPISAAIAASQAAQMGTISSVLEASRLAQLGPISAAVAASRLAQLGPISEEIRAARASKIKKPEEK